MLKNRLLWGLAAIIFLLPFERIGSVALNPATGHPMIRLVQIVAAVWLVFGLGRLLSGRERLRRVAGFRPLLLLAGSALVSAVLVNYGRVWQNYLWLIFIIGLFYYLAQQTAAGVLPLVYKALFASAAAVSAFGLYQYLGDVAGLAAAYTGLRPAYSKAVLGFPRIQSTALEPLYYANYLLLPVLVGLALLIVHKKRLSPWQWLGFGLIGLNFVLTMSRGAFLAILFGGLFLAVALRRELFTRAAVKRLALLLGAIGLAALGLIALATTVSRGSAGKGPESFAKLNSPAAAQTGSFTERAEAVRWASRLYVEAPVFGVGLGGLPARVYDYPPARRAGDSAVVNNETLEVLIELGALGFGLYWLFLVRVLAAGRRAIKHQPTDYARAWVVGLMAVVISTLIQAQTFSGFFITYRWVTLALLAGLASNTEAVKPSWGRIKQVI